LQPRQLLKKPLKKAQAKSKFLYDNFDFKKGPRAPFL